MDTGTTSDRIAASEVGREAFYSAFIAVLIACFTPLKPLGYLLPWLLTLWLGITTPHLIARNRFAALVLVMLILPFVYGVIVDEFLYANYIVSILTYSTLVPIFALRAEKLASRRLLDRMLLAIVTMIAVQGAIGIVQAVYGAIQTGTFSGSNGDRVQGTIYPFLSAEGRGANPIFAVNMAMMLLALLSRPDLIVQRRRFLVVIGALALVLASVMHVLMYLVASVVLAYVLARPPREKRKVAGRTGRLVFGLVVLVSGVTYVALRSNLDTIGVIAENVVNVEEGLSPRAIMLWSVATELPEEQPQQPYVGLGPGQFSSRASLIASGLYLGGPDNPKPIPFIEPQATQLSQKYWFPLLAMVADNPYIGSSQQPFFSLLSVYTEFGIVGLAVIGWFVVRLLIAIRRRVRDKPELRTMAITLITGILFMLMLGITENYWEIPQAILVGVLVLKVIYANVMAEPEISRSSSEECTQIPAT